MRRHRYPSANPQGTRYLITCELCGAQRYSPNRPGATYTARICFACHNERQARMMSRIMHRASQPGSAGNGAESSSADASVDRRTA